MCTDPGPQAHGLDAHRCALGVGCLVFANGFNRLGHGQVHGSGAHQFFTCNGLKCAASHGDGTYLRHLLGVAFDDANNIACRRVEVDAVGLDVQRLEHRLGCGVLVVNA